MIINTKILHYLTRGGISDFVLLAVTGLMLKVAWVMLSATGDLDLLKITLLRDGLEVTAAFIAYRVLTSLQDRTLGFNYGEFFNEQVGLNKVILVTVRNLSFALIIALVMS